MSLPAIRSADFEALAVSLDAAPKEPLPEIAFAGRSNVGKSSVINVLAGHHGLARVSGMPGRTQALVFFRVELTTGRPFRLVDLPGYGFARAAKSARRDWQGLVEAYLESRETLRQVVVLLDARRGLLPQDRELCTYLADIGRSYAIVMTKVDQLKKTERDAVARQIQSALSLPRPPFAFSVPKKEGREPLLRAILSWSKP